MTNGDAESGGTRSRGQTPSTFTERLNRLFELVGSSTTVGAGEPTNRQVADAITRREAELHRDGLTPEPFSISASYLQQLRSGTKTNPSMRTLEALAGYFAVPPAYFFDPRLAEEIESQLQTLRALRDSGVMQVATRAQGLSPESLNHVAQLIDHTRRLEGLDASPPDGRKVYSVQPRRKGP